MASVRVKLALTVCATGLVTALAVVAAVLSSFDRYENQAAFLRANAFLERVVARYDDLLDLRQRQPEEFRGWLRGLVLYEPDTQLYLLDADGTVLATSGEAQLPPGFKVALAPVREAVDVAEGRRPAGYVMGDDPERMDADAVVAARPVRRATIRPVDGAAAGYLYLVCHKPAQPATRWQAARNTLATPALVLVCAIVALTTLLAALTIAVVIRPLRRLTAAVAALSERGLDEQQTAESQSLLPRAGRDEFGQLTAAFSMLLDTLRRQWAALRRLDHFRREGVSNLSHDLRSPLTATVACLETLQTRWAGTESAEERRLVEVALRNTRNAARLVQSLGDLARLDEPTFALRRERVDAGELLDDIRARFAERAAAQGIALVLAPPAEPPAVGEVDIELFERAVANLVDNALKFCSAGCRVELGANGLPGGGFQAWVADDGPGIVAADQPHLFDRFYQARHSVAPAGSEGGKGLGLAIVARIVELHGGAVEVHSVPEAGTRIVLRLPPPALSPGGATSG